MTTKGEMTTGRTLLVNDSHIFFVQNRDADKGGDDDEGGAPIEEYLTIIVCSFKPGLQYLHCILQQR